MADVIAKKAADRAADRKPRIVFFGSGPVAAKSLELLIEWCDIEAVITKPQPLHHREKFPVIAVAEAHGLPLHTASKRCELDEVISRETFQSRVAILIDYGIIVSQQVIDSFPLGIINSHFSVLPEWRGADPISFAILSGQKQTGVSLMLLVEAMDEGPLLGYGEYDMPDTITAPELTEYLINLSDALLRHDVPRHASDEAVQAKKRGAPQSITGREISYSRKLSKVDGILDFNKPAAQLEREIRAFIDWPKSRTTLAGKDVIVTKAHAEPGVTAGAKPGDVRIVKEENTISVTTSSGSLCIDRLKPAGKSEMSTQAFLAGNKIK